MCQAKKLLKFYYRADRLNDALDNLIMRAAYSSACSEGGGERCALRIIALIGAKGNLGGLWNYLNSVMATFGADDKRVLKSYAFSARGYSSLPPERAKAVRRVVVRFMRRAKNLPRHAEAVKLVLRYFELLGR